MTDSPIATERLLIDLDGGAPPVLRQYFQSREFTGGRFDRFAGGGDAEAVADRFTSDDIVAVALLGVRIPGRAALDLLETKTHDPADLLAQVPKDVDLWSVQENILAPGAPADRLWHALVALPGLGWVSASKLLARKRPRLLPFYDRVVKQALGRSDEDSWWRPLRRVLAENPAIVDRLQELRDEVDLGDEISLLRVLDVCIWMRAYGRPEPTPDAES